MKVTDSRATKDYLDIKKVVDTGSTIEITYGSGGSFSGKAFTETKTYNKSRYGI